MNGLPHFIVWKNTGAAADGYLTGLEPATNLPNAKPFERGRGRVLRLPPGGRHETQVSIEILAHAEAVAAAVAEIDALQRRQPVAIYDRPLPEFSP